MASLTRRLLSPIRWENWVRYSAFASINTEATQRLKTPAPARTCLIVPVRLSSTSDLYQRPQHPAWKVNMLYDSECPLCVHEVKFLEKRDRNSYVKFTDINALDYDPALNGHVTYEEGMKKIHAVLTDGTVINGVPAFEKIYDIIGLGWVYGFTKIPVLLRLSEAVYDFWARHRMRLTGRPELEEVFEQRRKTIEHLKKSLENKVCDAKPREE